MVTGSESELSRRDLLHGILPFNLQKQLFSQETPSTIEPYNKGRVSQQNRLLMQQNQMATDESEIRSQVWAANFNLNNSRTSSIPSQVRVNYAYFTFLDVAQI